MLLHHRADINSENLQYSMPQNNASLLSEPKTARLLVDGCIYTENVDANTPSFSFLVHAIWMRILLGAVPVSTQKILTATPFNYATKDVKFAAVTFFLQSGAITTTTDK